MKRDSLRIKILQFLKLHQKMSVEQMEVLCHREGRKISNGERRLRELQDLNHPSYNSRVGEVKKNGAIVEYTYEPSPEERMHQNYQRTGQLVLN